VHGRRIIKQDTQCYFKNNLPTNYRGTTELCLPLHPGLRFPFTTPLTTLTRRTATNIKPLSHS